MFTSKGFFWFSSMKILPKVQGEKDEVFGLVFSIKISALAKILLSSKGRNICSAPRISGVTDLSSAHWSCRHLQTSSNSLVQESFGALGPTC